MQSSTIIVDNRAAEEETVDKRAPEGGSPVMRTKDDTSNSEAIFLLQNASVINYEQINPVAKKLDYKP
jgi:hypothetical protein